MIAWIGLGAMGSRMAARVAAAGHELVVWNRTRARAAALAGPGVRVADSPAEAVRHADVVFVMVADPPALASVTEGVAGAVRAGTAEGEGVAGAVRAGATVIDLSTVGPQAVGRLREALPDGVTLLDAPVLGSLAEAAAGTLTLLVGGPDDVVAAYTPLLSLLGEPVHVGPLGSGAAAKLVANSALVSSVAVLGETLSLADALGLPRETAWQVLARTPLAAQAERRRPAVESGSYPARFALAMAAKDTALVTAAPADLRMARAAHAWLADAVAAGLGEADYTAVLGHILAGPGAAAEVAAVSAATAPHYRWGEGCDGWRLADGARLSVIEERMPPGTAEVWHLHHRARQFFYVLGGRAVLRTPKGEVVLGAGEGVEVPQGLPHQLANTSGEELRFLVVSTPTTRGDRHPA